MATKNSGVLVDLTKCVGCGGCTVACKLWNDLSYEHDELGNTYNAHGYEAQLEAETWTTVTYYNELTNKAGEEGLLRYAKHQCMHCLEPACASVCFAKAIGVTEEGAVSYDASKCVGCRYCMLGCPYDVPKYEWDKSYPSIMKCQMCSDKLANGEATACSCVCPTGAITFGDRDELLAQAKATIASNPKYLDQIYGEKEAGGTRWLYISDTPFEELGFRKDVPEYTIKSWTGKYTKTKPFVFLGVLVVFGGIGLYTKRIQKMQAEKEAAAAEANAAAEATALQEVAAAQEKAAQIAAQMAAKAAADTQNAEGGQQ